MLLRCLDGCRVLDPLEWTLLGCQSEEMSGYCCTDCGDAMCAIFHFWVRVDLLMNRHGIMNADGGVRRASYENPFDAA